MIVSVCKTTLCLQGTLGLALSLLHGLPVRPPQCLCLFTQSSSLWMVKGLATLFKA